MLGNNLPALHTVVQLSVVSWVKHTTAIAILNLQAMLQACWTLSTGHIPPSWHPQCCTGLLDVEHRVAIAILKLRLCLQVTLVLSTEWQIAILTLHVCHRPVGRRT